MREGGKKGVEEKGIEPLQPCHPSFFSGFMNRMRQAQLTPYDEIGL
jgi:hypothetical protein